MNIFAVARHGLFALHVWGAPLAYYPVPGVYKSMLEPHDYQAGALPTELLLLLPRIEIFCIKD